MKPIPPRNSVVSLSNDPVLSWFGDTHQYSINTHSSVRSAQHPAVLNPFGKGTACVRVTLGSWLIPLVEEQPHCALAALTQG